MRRAEQVDSDNIIRDALLQNGHGMIYSIAKRHQANAPEHLADHTKTGAFIRFGN